jgi:hypothetical protein
MEFDLFIVIRGMSDSCFLSRVYYENQAALIEIVSVSCRCLCLFRASTTSEQGAVYHMTYARDWILRRMILDSLHTGDCSPSCSCLWHSLWLERDHRKLGMWLKRLVIGRRGPSVAGDVWRQLTDACRTLAMLVYGVENTAFTYTNTSRSDLPRRLKSLTSWQPPDSKTFKGNRREPSWPNV